MDHSLLILCALLLNAALAGPKAWYEAARLTRFSAMPGRAIRDLERKLNREYRSPADRQVRGWLLIAAAVLVCIVLGTIGGWVFQHGLVLIELALVTAMLPVRPVWDRAMTIRRSLTSIDIPAARHALVGTPWRHHALLDEFGLARAAIENTIIDLSEKIVAPVICYLLFGLPGLLICKVLTLMHDAIGYAPDFGKGARVVHSVLHVIPSRVTSAFWLATSAFLPSHLPPIGGAMFDAFLTKSPRVLCLSAAAAVGRVSLGGPTSPYFSAWADGGTVKATVLDIRRAQVNYLVSVILLFVLVGIL